MTKLPVEGPAKDLFLDALVHLKLAVYCFCLAIAKVVRGHWNAIHAKALMISRITLAWYRKRRQEVFVFWGTCGWSLSCSLFIIQMYSV